MDTTMSVEVDRPVAEVFDYTITHVAEWSNLVVKDEMISQKPGWVGSTFHVITEENGRRMEFDGVVTRHRAPTLHAVLMTGKQFDVEAEYRFEDLGGRTRVTQESRVRGKGLLKLLFLLLGPFLKGSGRASLEKELRNLKRLAESRAA